jgi:hypothetical protein
VDIFGKIAERKIREAMEVGMFENLSGKGRPLVFEDETWIPDDLKAAYRFLKNSGYIPPELELKNEIMNLKRLIDTLDDNQERLKKMRELNYKIINFNIMRKRPLNLEAFPEYENKILGKMIPS